MEKQQVTQILQELAEQEVPANVDLWPAIRAQVQTQRRPSRWSRVMPVTRLGWAFLALTLFLTLGAVTYALAPIVMSRLFQQEAGLRHVEQANMVQELNLSQTVDGVTVTLERAYADANRIVIGFTIKSPPGQRYDAYHLTLTDAAGTVFPSTVGYGAAGQSDIFNVSLPPGEGAYILSFDAAAVTGVPEELDLRLVMEVGELVLPSDACEASPTSDSPPAEPPDSMVVMLEPLPTPTIVGTLTFDFSVPFIPGRVAEVNQTVEAAGVAVCLERVVVTPSETRAYLRFDSPGGVETRWTPIALLKAPGDGDEESEGYPAYSGNDDPPGYQYGFLAPLYERQGEWTLTVTELVGTELVPPYSDVQLAGPWVFRFRIP
ncbi:MAG: hypothetical protein DRI52_09120 [Chloroflexi bacterium]|nr:MAG: hypothetical protein DRI52_09120 [Chloroflexota bacterium]